MQDYQNILRCFLAVNVFNLKINKFIWHVFTRIIASSPLANTALRELRLCVRILRMKCFDFTSGCEALCASGGDCEEAGSDSWSVH